MKKIFSLLCAAMVSLSLCAQESAASEVRVPQFGYISYKSVYEQMPEYATAKAAFEELKAKYDAEAKHSEEEFQRKFSEFLQGQKDFPPSIMQKRQLELQDLMNKSVAFRQESQRLLKQAEIELQAPCAAKLSETIQAVAGERGLFFVLNTDDNAVPFIHPQAGVDITDAVLIRLGIVARPQ